MYAPIPHAIGFLVARRASAILKQGFWAFKRPALGRNRGVRPPTYGRADEAPDLRGLRIAQQPSASTFLTTALSSSSSVPQRRPSGDEDQAWLARGGRKPRSLTIRASGFKVRRTLQRRSRAPFAATCHGAQLREQLTAWRRRDASAICRDVGTCASPRSEVISGASLGNGDCALSHVTSLRHCSRESPVARRDRPASRGAH